MISASGFTVLLEHPASPFVAALPDPFLRRMLIGIAMALTALTLTLSPIGKRSGAHFNPAVTLTFWRLGKVQPWDAFFYVVAQFLGGIAGVAGVAALVPHLLEDASVNYVATQPGAAGVDIAFAAEFAISFILMLTILTVGNHSRLSRYTPFFAATLVATFITFEAPLSGMSMNPARTFGSAFVGHVWTGLWIYFTAPVLAMLCAAGASIWAVRASRTPSWFTTLRLPCSQGSQPKKRQSRSALESIRSWQTRQRSPWPATLARVGRRRFRPMPTMSTAPSQSWMPTPS